LLHILYEFKKKLNNIKSQYNHRYGVEKGKQGDGSHIGLFVVPWIQM